MNIITITAGLDEIRDTYFEDGAEDNESFPTVIRTGLLLAELEGHSQELENDLLDWHCQHLSWHETLRYSETHLAAFLQTGTLRVTDIYLFTFADLSSFQAGVAEIQEVCRRQR
jgi:hypothetical protein